MGIDNSLVHPLISMQHMNSDGMDGDKGLSDPNDMVQRVVIIRKSTYYVYRSKR